MSIKQVLRMYYCKAFIKFYWPLRTYFRPKTAVNYKVTDPVYERLIQALNFRRSTACENVEEADKTIYWRYDQLHAHKRFFKFLETGRGRICRHCGYHEIRHPISGEWVADFDFRQPYYVDGCWVDHAKEIKHG